MKAKRIPSPLFGLLIAASLLSAQGEPVKAQEAKPKEASAKVEPGIPLTFTATGLTKDNLGKVKESLVALVRSTYACDQCKVEQGTPGKCSGCSADLVATQHPCFQSVVPSADDSTVKLVLEPSAAVHYSELERALAKNYVKIDAAKFPIAGKAHLLFQGGTAEQSSAIEKALKDAKLFDEVKASYDAGTKEIHVLVRAGSMPPMRAKVISTLESSGEKLALSDIVWGQMQKKRAS